MQKTWLDHYEEGVPHEIDPNEYSSLVTLLESTCKQYAKSVACVNMGTEITFEQLDAKAMELAIFLQQLGLKKGDRVALMMPNLLQYPIALLGVLRAGFVIVNTNPMYTPDEVVHQINDSGAETIIVLANFAHTVEKALPKTKLKNIIITELGDAFPCYKRIFVNFMVKYVKKLVPKYNIPQAISYHKGIQSAKNKTLKPVTLSHDDIAFLQYTGGTTGVAKGAILTHGNMVSNVLQTFYWVQPLHLNKNDVIVTALPLYHIFSLTANCLTFLKSGVKNILITNPRDMSSMIDDIKHYGITTLTGVNTLFNAMLNHPRFHEIDFSRLRLALSGGMALQKSVSLKWREMTKSRILEAYGLTETCPAVTINPMYLEKYNGSIGLPLPSTDVSIRDDNEKEVDIGQPGELCVKGPQVMRGYWNRPDETAAAFTKDGFFKTGDIAKIDDQGYLYLVDRKKDMILVSGFNVYPNEVEQVIGLMPEVLEVGVVGYTDEGGNEHVKACIVKRDPSLTVEKVVAHCREHLTGYKIPKVVEFFNELPKTNVGKILRRALR